MATNSNFDYLFCARKAICELFFLVQILRPTHHWFRWGEPNILRAWNITRVDSLIQFLDDLIPMKALAHYCKCQMNILRACTKINQWTRLCVPLPSSTHNEQADRTRENRWKIGHRLCDAFGCSLHVWCVHHLDKGCSFAGSTTIECLLNHN